MGSLAKLNGAVLAVLLAGSAYAQGPVQAPAGPDDSDFLRGAAQTGMAEIELGDLAAVRAKKSELRTLAKELADEHREINSALYSLATQQGVAMPGSLDADTRIVVNEISAKTDEEFDRALLAWLDAAHVSQANLYDQQMRVSVDEDVRDYARRHAETMMSHLGRIRQLAAADE